MPQAIRPTHPRNLLSDLHEKTPDDAFKIFVRAIEQSPVSVIITNPKGIIEYVNPKFTQLMGFTPDEAIGKTPRIIKGGFLSRDFYQEMWDTILSGQEWHGVFHNRTKSGQLVWEVASISPIRDENGAVTHFVGMKEDITEVKRLQDELDHMARHDALTGLPNRALFFDRLEQAIALSKRKRTQFAVLYLDLDGFKPVNDTFGHEVGDRLLVGVANRFKGAVRESDTVARVGGDEFTFILNDVAAPSVAEEIAHKALGALSAPFILDATPVQIGASIGLAIYPDDGTESNTLLSAADKAMYKVKRAGKNGVGLPARN